MLATSKYNPSFTEEEYAYIRALLFYAFKQLIGW